MSQQQSRLFLISQSRKREKRETSEMIIQSTRSKSAYILDGLCTWQLGSWALNIERFLDILLKQMFHNVNECWEATEWGFVEFSEAQK